MFPAQFEYHRAESLDEALSLLGQHGGAKVLAGGHSLLPMMKLRLAQPPALVDIGRVGELRGIRRSGDSLRIGSLTTHAEVAASKEIRSGCAILAEAAGKIGDPHVRNLGTVGGNIAHADPASDLPAVLVALAATIHLKSAGGSRQVAAGDFFLDLLTTDMKPGEILTAVEVPVLQGAGSAYLKVEHPASGYAICGAAAVVDRNGGRTALAFNGVTAKPYHAKAVTDALGGDVSDESIDRAVAEHLAIDDPLGDVQASGEYRVELAKVWGRRALKAARDR